MNSFVVLSLTHHVVVRLFLLFFLLHDGSGSRSGLGSSRSSGDGKGLWVGEVFLDLRMGLASERTPFVRCQSQIDG